MIKRITKKILSILISYSCRIYTYSMSQKFKGYRDRLYTMWIRNFLGSVSDEAQFAYPLILQGGASKRISIGSSSFQGHCILGCWEKHGSECYNPKIIIGNGCSIGEYNHISAINTIIIGDGLLTGRFVYIGDNSHGGLSWEEANVPPAKRKLKSKGGITIGRNVWIGDKVTILGGVSIGDNVIIGAGSIVNHNIPSNSVWGGVSSSEKKRLPDVL